MYPLISRPNPVIAGPTKREVTGSLRFIQLAAVQSRGFQPPTCQHDRRTGDMEYPAAMPRSLGLDVGGPDHPTPLLHHMGWNCYGIANSENSKANSRNQ
jgi:hypothetical protein